MKFHLRKKSCTSCGRGTVRNRKRKRCRSAEDAEVEQQLEKRNAREVGEAEEVLKRRHIREGTAETTQKKRRSKEGIKKQQLKEEVPQAEAVAREEQQEDSQ